MDAFFTTAGDGLLEHIIEGSTEIFADNLKSACEQFYRRLKDGEMSTAAIHSVQQRVALLRDCASFFLTLRSESDRMIAETGSYASFLALGQPKPEIIAEEVANEDASDLAGTSLFRRWFLDNIAHPFPSTDTKHKLVELTNSAIRHESTYYDSSRATTYETCQLWFINSRRRSHWTQFYRKFAISRPERMLTLCQALKKQDGEARATIELRLSDVLKSWRLTNAEELTIVAKECFDHFQQITHWIERKPSQETGSWLDNVISEGQREYKAARELAKENRQRSKAWMQGDATEALYSAQDISLAKGVKRKSSSEDEDSSRPSKIGRSSYISADRRPTQSQVGQPSATRSNRTYSGSSASSHGSMPSLIEAGSSSYDSCEGPADTRSTAFC